MFAMLVGKLPFKVKPFNLKKLYQKMITGDMELLPPGTSQGMYLSYLDYHYFTFYFLNRYRCCELMLGLSS